MIAPSWRNLREVAYWFAARRYLRQIERRFEAGESLLGICHAFGIRPPGAPAGGGRVALARLRAVERTVQRIERRQVLGCYKRSLLGGALLRDMQPALRLGVSSSASPIAHAWLVVADQELFRGSTPFTPLQPVRDISSSQHGALRKE